TDSGSLSEAGAVAVVIAATDSGTLSEASQVDTGSTPTASDSGSLSESAAIAARLSPAGALRGYGTGSGNIDRVWLPLEAGGARTPIDVGNDFTYEFRLKCRYADN